MSAVDGRPRTRLTSNISESASSVQKQSTASDKSNGVTHQSTEEVGDVSTAMDPVIDVLIQQVQPDRESLQQREAVFAFVQGLIVDCFKDVSVRVCLFGSVPIRTYLPHGDIDCTFFVAGKEGEVQSLPNWPQRLKAYLDDYVMQYQAGTAPFSWRPPQFGLQSVTKIPAEVTLLKLNVFVHSPLNRTIVVDISFNMMGGVNAANFLEEMDRYVDAYHAVKAGSSAPPAELIIRWRSTTDSEPDRPHLLKRSIILIKAWAYYEARILGAQAGLLSSYSLEVMVLYVLQHYHDAATTPWTVMKTFLRVIGSYDWSANALSVLGTVPLATLDDTTDQIPLLRVRDQDAEAAETPLVPETEMHALLARFCTKTRSPGATGWRRRFINICDPLQHLNNIGRSVSKANAVRIIAAMKHVSGAVQSCRANCASTKSAEDWVSRHLFQNPLGVRTSRPQWRPEFPASVPGAGVTGAPHNAVSSVPITHTSAPGSAALGQATVWPPAASEALVAGFAPPMPGVASIAAAARLMQMRPNGVAAAPPFSVSLAMPGSNVPRSDALPGPNGSAGGPRVVMPGVGYPGRPRSQQPQGYHQQQHQHHHLHHHHHHLHQEHAHFPPAHFVPQAQQPGNGPGNASASIPYPVHVRLPAEASMHGSQHAGDVASSSGAVGPHFMSPHAPPPASHEQQFLVDHHHRRTNSMTRIKSAPVFEALAQPQGAAGSVHGSAHGPTSRPQQLLKSRSQRATMHGYANQASFAQQQGHHHRAFAHDPALHNSQTLASFERVLSGGKAHTRQNSGGSTSTAAALPEDMAKLVAQDMRQQFPGRSDSPKPGLARSNAAPHMPPHGGERGRGAHEAMMRHAPASVARGRYDANAAVAGMHGGSTLESQVYMLAGHNRLYAHASTRTRPDFEDPDRAGTPSALLNHEKLAALLQSQLQSHSAPAAVQSGDDMEHQAPFAPLHGVDANTAVMSLRDAQVPSSHEDPSPRISASSNAPDSAAVTPTALSAHHPISTGAVDPRIRPDGAEQQQTRPPQQRPASIVGGPAAWGGPPPPPPAAAHAQPVALQTPFSAAAAARATDLANAPAAAPLPASNFTAASCATSASSVQHLGSSPRASYASAAGRAVGGQVQSGASADPTNRGRSESNASAWPATHLNRSMQSAGGPGAARPHGAGAQSQAGSVDRRGRRSIQEQRSSAALHEGSGFGSGQRGPKAANNAVRSTPVSRSLSTMDSAPVKASKQKERKAVSGRSSRQPSVSSFASREDNGTAAAPSPKSLAGDDGSRAASRHVSPHGGARVKLDQDDFPALGGGGAGDGASAASASQSAAKVWPGAAAARTRAASASGAVPGAEEAATAHAALPAQATPPKSEAVPDLGSASGTWRRDAASAAGATGRPSMDAFARNKSRKPGPGRGGGANKSVWGDHARTDRGRGQGADGQDPRRRSMNGAASSGSAWHRS